MTTDKECSISNARYRSCYMDLNTDRYRLKEMFKRQSRINLCPTTFSGPQKCSSCCFHVAHQCSNHASPCFASLGGSSGHFSFQLLFLLSLFSFLGTWPCYCMCLGGSPIQLVSYTSIWWRFYEKKYVISFFQVIKVTIALDSKIQNTPTKESSKKEGPE